MKCQILFSGKNKQTISKCPLLKIVPNILSVSNCMFYYNIGDSNEYGKYASFQRQLRIRVFAVTMWSAWSEKVPTSTRKMCGITPSRACARFHQDLSSPLIYSVVPNDSVSGQWRPWSDCTDAQADLGLRCPHMFAWLASCAFSCTS